MLKQLRFTLFTVLIALFVASAHAQVNRVVVLPFDTPSAIEALQTGLPATLQLSLQQLDGVYVPPVGDAVLVATKAERAGQDVFETIGRLFNASAIVTGDIERTSSGYTADILVRSGGSDHFLRATGASTKELAEATALVVAGHLLGRLSSDQSAAIALAANETPSSQSLYHLGFATAGLPGVRASDLGVASRQDSDSVWLTLEYARLLLAEGRRADAQDVFAGIDAIPAVSELHVLAAVITGALGDEETALGHYNEALAINAANAMALTGRASLSLYNDADAFISAQDAQAIAPRLIEAYILAANLEENEARAVQTYLRAEQHLPDSVLLRSIMVDQFLKQGDNSGALRYLQGAVKEPFNRNPSMYALAALLPASSADAALALVKEGLEHFPNEADLLLAQAELYMKVGRLSEAQNIAAALHDQFPTSDGVTDLYAVILVQAGQLDDASRLLTNHYGDTLLTQLITADFFISGGHANKAREILERLLADEPNNADVRALYGTALLRLGRLDDAATQLAEALRIEPEHRYALRSNAQLEQQRELLQDSDPIELNEQASALFQQGLALLDDEDFLPAAEAFAAAREHDSSGLVTFYEAYALHLGGRVRDAIDAYEEAKSQLGTSVVVANNLGFAYLSIGRYDKALPELRRAVQLNPEHAQAQLNLGLAYFQLGRADDARAALQTAASLDASLTGPVNELLAAINEAE